MPCLSKAHCVCQQIQHEHPILLTSGRPYTDVQAGNSSFRACTYIFYMITPRKFMTRHPTPSVYMVSGKCCDAL